jgi:hypothetical protein
LGIRKAVWRSSLSCVHYMHVSIRIQQNAQPILNQHLYLK